MVGKAKTSDPAKGPGKKAGNGETISGYFRRVFRENPKLLKTRSNDELLRRWRDDHPGEDEIPKGVKVGLQNVKSILRSKGRKRKAKAAAAAPAAPNSQPARPAPKKTDLERLEEQIDDVLTAARGLHREGLESVVGNLLRARREVVWMMGQ